LLLAVLLLLLLVAPCLNCLEAVKKPPPVAFKVMCLLPSYAPSYVSPAYHLLEGFPFIQEPPSGDLQERVLIRHHDYDQCFQSVQLLQWNSQVKFNVTVYRNLPTTRDSIMTS